MAVEAILRGKPMFSDAKTGYVICRALVDGRQAVVKGNMPDVKDGKRFFVEGFWTSGKGQPAFQVTAAVEPQLIGDRTQIDLMEDWRIPGLTRQIAERLFDAFDGEPIAAISEYPAEVLGVSGVSSDMGELITRECVAESKRVQFRRNLIAIGLPLQKVQDLFDKLDKQQIDTVLAKPYFLYLFDPEVGLGAADRFSRICKVEDPEGRIAALALRQIFGALNDSGSTKCLRQDAKNAKSRNRLDGSDFEKGLDQCIQAGAVQILGSYIQPTHVFYAEARVVDEICRLLEAPVPKKSSEAVGPYVKGVIQRQGKISGGQLDAVAGLARRRFGILHGKPGVGKSVTAEALIQTVLEVYGVSAGDVTLLAPTAKAAQRLTETTGRPASTIHRALECNNQGRFNRCKATPLDGKVFILDEMSMADTGLCAALLEAIPDNAFCYWLGDPNQQPSVAPGRVLYDIIRTGKCNDHELTKTWRQGDGSAIVDVCADVVAGTLPDLSNSHPAGDFRFIETASDEEAIETIVKINRALSAKVGPSDVAVLTPLNNSTVGQVPLNARLQQTHNPTPSESLIENGKQLGVGDIVLQQKNNYQLGIYNGDEGVIVSVDSNKRYLRVQFGDRIVGIGGKGVADLALGYARTVHKSQGSEYPYVITTALDSEEFALNINGLNTAISRGKRLVVVIGSKDAIARGVRRSAVEDRITDLQRKLEARFGPEQAPSSKLVHDALRPPVKAFTPRKSQRNATSRIIENFGEITYDSVAGIELLGANAVVNNGASVQQGPEEPCGDKKIATSERSDKIDRQHHTGKPVAPPAVF